MTDYLFEYVTLTHDPDAYTNLLSHKLAILLCDRILPSVTCLIGGLLFALTCVDTITVHWYTIE